MEALLKAAERCFLGLLPPSDLREVLAEGSLVHLSESETVPREEHPAALFLVVEGEIKQFDPRTGDAESEVAGPGSVLEPEVLFQKKGAWTNLWTSQTRSTVFKLDFERVRSALSRALELKEYLDRVFSSRELATFRKNLLLLGLKEADLVLTFKSLMPMRFTDFLESGEVQGVGILILRTGKISVFQAKDGSPQAITQFNTGDYFSWEGALSLIFEADPDTQVWWLNNHYWANALKSHHKVIFLIRMMDSVGQRLKALSQNQKVEEEPDDQDKESIELPSPVDVDSFFFGITEQTHVEWKGFRKASCLYSTAERDGLWSRVSGDSF